MQTHALTLLRVVVAVLIAAHGWARLLADAVTPFGHMLDGRGIPFGMAVAWGITVLEIAGSPLLALRRAVFPLTALYMAIYATGIVMVHAKHGWFVVGLGRNGVEFSVLLITALMCVAMQDLPGRGGVLRRR
jgi:putative oxidoreductase